MSSLRVDAELARKALSLLTATLVVINDEALMGTLHTLATGGIHNPLDAQEGTPLAYIVDVLVPKPKVRRERNRNPCSACSKNRQGVGSFLYLLPTYDR